MKKYMLYIIMFVTATAQAGAQQLPVNVTDVSVRAEGDQVQVTCRIDAPRKAVKGDQTFVLTPVLRHGVQWAELTRVVVQGRRAAVSERRRALWNQTDLYPGAVRLHPGQGVDYAATLTREAWMEDSELELAATVAACCSERSLPITALVRVAVYSTEDNAMIGEIPAAVQQQIDPLPEPAHSTGQELAARYPFIAPISQYGENPSRETSLPVYFRVAQSSNVDRQYMGNGAILDQLAEAVREIERSADCRVARITVAGYASPEGSPAFNERLASERAATLCSYITRETGVSAETIEAAGHGADWEGLRALVAASDQPWRAEALRIIDTMPVWNAARQVGRLGALMRLQGGDPYRYMAQNYFPSLRSAVYIKVYYENK